MKTTLTPEAFVRDVALQTWELFKRDPLLMVVASFVVVLGSVLSLGILAGTLSVGFVLIVRRRLRDQPAQLGDVFNFDHFIGSLLAVLLIGLAVMLGFALLILPGILVAVFCTFTLQAMAYEDLSAIEAITASGSLVKENLPHAALVILAVAVLNAVAGAVVLATVITTPLSMIAVTVAYEVLTGRRALPEQAGPSVPEHPRPSE